MLQLAPRYYLAKGKGCHPSLRVRVAFCGVVLPRHALHTPILSLSLPHQRRHSLALVNEWPKPPRLLHHLTWLCHGSTQDLFKLWYHNTTTHARTHGHNDATTKETTQQRKQRRNNATTQQRNNATTNATTQLRKDERNKRKQRHNTTTQQRTKSGGNVRVFTPWTATKPLFTPLPKAKGPHTYIHAWPWPKTLSHVTPHHTPYTLTTATLTTDDLLPYFRTS